MGDDETTATEQNNPEPRPIAVNNTPESSPYKTASDGDTSKQPPERMTTFQKLELFVTTVGVVVAIGVLCIYNRQLGEMRRSVDEIAKQTHQVQRSARSAELAASASERANALNARGIEQALVASRNERRAYIASTSWTLEKEPVVGDKILRVKAAMLNSGRTSAHTAIDRTRIGLYFGDAPRPNWNLTNAVKTWILHPNSPIDMLVELPNLTRPQIDAYRAKETVITVRILVTYRDVFNGDHWVESCVTHKFGDPVNWFPFCKSSGNDFDHE